MHHLASPHLTSSALVGVAMHQQPAKQSTVSPDSAELAAPSSAPPRPLVSPRSRRSVSLPELLRGRESWCPFRPLLKRDILNSLLNSYYVMNSDGDITELHDQVTAIAAAPSGQNL